MAKHHVDQCCAKGAQKDKGTEEKASKVKETMTKTLYILRPMFDIVVIMLWGIPVGSVPASAPDLSLQRMCALTGWILATCVETWVQFSAPDVGLAQP